MLDTVIMGNARLYEIMKEKEAIYAKEDFSDEDGIRASELEAEFADMNGWEAESDAATLLTALGIETELHYTLMKDLLGAQKVKVLLPRPCSEIPTSCCSTSHEPPGSGRHRLAGGVPDHFPNTVIVVSHDRYFLNKVCTQIADID